MTALPHGGSHGYGYLTHPLPDALERLEARFAETLVGAAAVAVAFSGGVDSSVTLALTARTLGRDRVVAVLGVSPSLSALERRQALATARALGVECREVRTFELDDPAYVANRGDRCYFCKYELYTRAFLSGVSELRCDLFINGDTADDHRAADRPGRRAASELGVRSPLAEAGIDKSHVRSVARSLGLEVWDKPSAPCLASRVPVNTPVTRERLGQVERAEAGLRSLGLGQLRVRHLGAAARVELGADELARINEPDLGNRVARAVTDAGFTSVEFATEPLARS